MSQVFHVLRCFKCDTFQVHVVKKINKWCCKICNEKQSIKHVYGKGNGKECRQHVQKLNNLRMEEDMCKDLSAINTVISDSNVDNISIKGSESYAFNVKNLQSFDQNLPSMWSKFMEHEQDDLENNLKEDGDEEMLDGCKVVLEIINSKKKRELTSKFEGSAKKIKPANINDLEPDSHDLNKENAVKEISNTAQHYHKQTSQIKNEGRKNQQKLKNDNNIVVTNSKWSKFIPTDEDLDTEIESDEEGADAKEIQGFPETTVDFTTKPFQQKSFVLNGDTSMLTNINGSKWSDLDTSDSEHKADSFVGSDALFSNIELPDNNEDLVTCIGFTDKSEKIEHTKNVINTNIFMKDECIDELDDILRI